MPIKVYICEYCRKPYVNRMDARWCEILHEQHSGINYYNENAIKAIKKEGKNPCDYCNRGYYVYGSDFNCDCFNKCNNYSLFIAKEAMNDYELVHK